MSGEGEGREGALGRGEERYREGGKVGREEEGRGGNRKLFSGVGKNAANADVSAEML